MVSERYVIRKRRAPPAGCLIPSITSVIRSVRRVAAAAIPGTRRSPCAACRRNARPALPTTQQTTAVKPPLFPVPKRDFIQQTAVRERQQRAESRGQRDKLHKGLFLAIYFTAFIQRVCGDIPTQVLILMENPGLIIKWSYR